MRAASCSVSISLAGGAMNSRICSAILTLIAALAPGAASATLIFSDMRFIADTSFSAELLPDVSNADTQDVPNNGAGAVNALTLAPGALFPNVPVTINLSSAFASASFATFGGGGITSGVGANGFFLRNSLPPNHLSATALMFQSITNDSSTVTESVRASFFIPAPTLRFFGVGDFFPAGADPARDAFGVAQARLLTTLRRADGLSSVSDTILEYGLQTVRDIDPLNPGKFSAIALSPEDSVDLVRFDEPDGSIVFRLPALGVNLALPDIGPGEILDLAYVFQAGASTGFGETGIFAAVGDPFDLTANGARFELQIGNVVNPPVPGVSEPNTFAVLGLGLAMLGMSARRRCGALRLSLRGQEYKPHSKST
jgi:hypothetical protein